MGWSSLASTRATRSQRSASASRSASLGSSTVSGVPRPVSRNASRCRRSSAAASARMSRTATRWEGCLARRHRSREATLPASRGAQETQTCWPRAIATSQASASSSSASSHTISSPSSLPRCRTYRGSSRMLCAIFSAPTGVTQRRGSSPCSASHDSTNRGRAPRGARVKTSQGAGAGSAGGAASLSTRAFCHAARSGRYSVAPSSAGSTCRTRSTSSWRSASAPWCSAPPLASSPRRL
mmetsp:Transcript_86322/g.234039  ORF Transcript_86322/g.234039 Transcript_86322/m.234039 type:complete len:239 (+) Transcript_86322:1019-1735(+)